MLIYRSTRISNMPNYRSLQRWILLVYRSFIIRGRGKDNIKENYAPK